MVILGIHITDDLLASYHVDSVFTFCSQSMYMYSLKVLKGHGLPASVLHIVTRGHHYRPAVIRLPCVEGPYYRKRSVPSGQTL